MAGGTFRNANAWDGCPEICEEVLIAKDCNAFEEIKGSYEEFSWDVPGKYPNSKKTIKAKVTILGGEEEEAEPKKTRRRGPKGHHEPDATNGDAEETQPTDDLS